MDKIKLQFYRINACEYYSSKENKFFCDLKSTLNHINKWAFTGAKPLVETCTYEASEDSVNNTYCFDMSQHSNDFVMTTWNESENLDGEIASANGTDIAGHVNVKTSEIEEGFIPGVPTFFWFIPDQNRFATIKFNGQRINGHTGLKKLFKGFLNLYSPHVLKEHGDLDNEIKVFGYRKDISSKIILNGYKPYFETSIERNLGKIDFLRENVNKIRKVIRRSKLQENISSDKDFFTAFFNRFGLGKKPDRIQSLNFEAEINFKPTIDELEAMIKEWESSRNDSWLDFGFKLTNDNNTYWFSHSLVKTETEVQIERNGNLVMAASLLNELTKQKEILLRSINEVD